MNVKYKTTKKKGKKDNKGKRHKYDICDCVVCTPKPSGIFQYILRIPFIALIFKYFFMVIIHVGKNGILIKFDCVYAFVSKIF